MKLHATIATATLLAWIPPIARPDAPPASIAAPTGEAAAAPAQPPVSPAAGLYVVGLLLGSELAHTGLTPIPSFDSLIRGLKDASGGQVITAAQRDEALRYMHDAREALAERNRTAGRQFLERNAKLAGVNTMPSGLQYRVLAAGDVNGKSPAPNDHVTVRYTASLADGTEFDRSDTHDQPAMFRVNSVFKGWQDAFLAMKRGAKWQLFVPPELGYGVNSPPAVPPGAVLIYQLELLHIEPSTPIDKAPVRPRPLPKP